SRTRDEACVRPDQISGDLVTPTARWKELDDLVIGNGNDKHGDGCRRCHVEPKMRVPAERQERLLWAIASRRAPVHAKSDPGKEGDEGNVLSGRDAERVEPLAQQGLRNLHAANSGTLVIRPQPPRLTLLTQKIKPISRLTLASLEKFARLHADRRRRGN